MCRSTDYQRFRSNQENRLRIKALFVRFSRFKSHNYKSLPESLTLVYLPRIDENFLEIDGKKIRPDSPAFVTLYRVVSSSTKDAVFGSRERVRASEGVQFQVYLSEEKLIQGIFRKDDAGQWKLECKCKLETEIAGAEVSEAEICVDVEGQVAMLEKVALVVKRKKNCCFAGLEEIPEGREVDTDTDTDDCCCCCCENTSGDEEDIDAEDWEENEVEMEVDGVRWAVDVGIWAVCLGVGLLVSRAAVAGSGKTLRRRRII